MDGQNAPDASFLTCRDASARAASAGCFPHSGLPPGTSCRVWVAKRCAKRGNGAWVVSVRRTSRYAAKIVCRCVRPYQSDVVPVQKNRLKRRRLASLRGVFAAPCEVSRGSSRGWFIAAHARTQCNRGSSRPKHHYSLFGHVLQNHVHVQIEALERSHELSVGLEYDLRKGGAPWIVSQSFAHAMSSKDGSQPARRS